MASFPSDFDFTSLSYAALDQDPHDIFRAARARMPFFKRCDGVYLILRAKDVEDLFTSPKTRQLEDEFLALRGVTEGGLYDFFKLNMLFSNEEVHRNRRGPLTRQFAFRAIEELRPNVRALSVGLLQDLTAEMQLSVRDEFAALLPAQTIAFILGISPMDIPHFTSLVYRVARAFSYTWSLDDLPDMNAAASELADYVERLIVERRARPRNDFLSEYIRMVEAAGNLSAVEEIQQLVIVIVGGSDTTRAAMVTLVSLLLQNPSQLQAVRDDRSLIAAAVWEALRIEPSVGSVTRFATEDIILEGATIPQGSIISLSTLSALRDPLRYEDPDKFDIYRGRPKWHYAFGGGPHRCLGEALAKVELEEGLSALLDRMPHMRAVSGYPSISGHVGIRRVGELILTGQPSEEDQF